MGELEPWDMGLGPWDFWRIRILVLCSNDHDAQPPADTNDMAHMIDRQEISIRSCEHVAKVPYTMSLHKLC